MVRRKRRKVKTTLVKEITGNPGDSEHPALSPHPVIPLGDLERRPLAAKILLALALGVERPRADRTGDTLVEIRVVVREIQGRTH